MEIVPLSNSYSKWYVTNRAVRYSFSARLSRICHYVAAIPRIRLGQAELNNTTFLVWALVVEAMNRDKRGADYLASSSSVSAFDAPYRS